MGWWSEQLAKQQGQQQQQQPAPRAPSRVAPSNLPMGMTVHSNQQVADRYLQNQVAPVVAQQPVGASGNVFDNDLLYPKSMKSPESNDGSNCPSCGSVRYIANKKGGGVTTSNGIVYPRGECPECGYPVEQGTLGAPIQAGGGPSPSRQSPQAALPFASEAVASFFSN